MLLETIRNCLKEHFNINILHDKTNRNITKIALLEGNQASYSEDVLYFGMESQLSDTMLPECCILAADQVEIQINDRTCQFLAIIPTPKLFAAFNYISNQIDKSHGKNLYEELKQIADQEKRIEPVINAAASRIGNPIVFVDTNFMLEAYSAGVPMQDRIWLENIKKGYCDYDFIQKVQALIKLQKETLSTFPNEVTCAATPFRKFCSNVFIRSSLFGYIIMIEDQVQVTGWHTEMMETLSRIISYTVSFYEPYLFENKDKYERLLYNLVIGTPFSELSDDMCRLDVPANMIILFVSVSQYFGQKYIKNQLTSALLRTFPKSYIAYHGNGIVCLLDAKDFSNMKQEHFENIYQFAEQEHVRIGISNEFSNIANTKMHFAQAQKALSLNLKFGVKQMVCFYSDYQIMDLFSEVKDKVCLGQYCHPLLHRMRQYDAENETDFYDTVQIYLRNSCSIKNASEALFIHRNTMVYRLEKIKELWNIDLTDYKIRLQLQISYMIDQFLGYNKY